MIDKLGDGMFGYRNVFVGIYKISSREGIFALWRGCGARIMHMSGQAAVNLTLLEKIRGYLIRTFDSK